MQLERRERWAGRVREKDGVHQRSANAGQGPIDKPDLPGREQYIICSNIEVQQRLASNRGEGFFFEADQLIQVADYPGISGIWLE